MSRTYRKFSYWDDGMGKAAHMGVGRLLCLADLGDVMQLIFTLTEPKE